MCACLYLCVSLPREGTNLHSGSHWYAPHHCLLDLLSFAHREREEGVRLEENKSVETGGKIADCSDLANLSDQSKLCVLLWSNRIRLLRCYHHVWQTNAWPCTRTPNLGKPSWSSKLAHWTHASPKAAAKVAELNQTDGLVCKKTHVHTHRMTALIHAADTTFT